VARNFHAGVAVFAIDLILAGMQLVRKRNRLIGLITLVVTNNDFIISEGPNEDTKTRETKDDHQTKELFHEQDPMFTFKVVGEFSISSQIIKLTGGILSSTRLNFWPPITHC